MAKVLVNIPDPLLKEIDRRARNSHLSRSEATREAFRQWLMTREYVPPRDRPGIRGIEARMAGARKMRWGMGSAEKQMREERERL